MEYAKILCTDDQCKHNGGGGYYGLCHHPDNLHKMPYCGIERSYVSTCKKREVEDRKDHV